jgi:hypothetical protein
MEAPFLRASFDFDDAVATAYKFMTRAVGVRQQTILMVHTRIICNKEVCCFLY